MQSIMEVLDRHKTVLLSMMTLPPEEGGEEWLIVLRLKSENAEQVVKALTSAGFDVVDVD